MEKVRSIDELLTVIASVKEQHPTLQLSFRGQQHAWPLAPSAARAVTPDEHKFLAVDQALWGIAANHLIPMFARRDSKEMPWLASMAVLQHYGFKSWFVDITFDPIVAAWFAVNAYEPKRILLAPPSFGTSESRYVSDHSVASVKGVTYRRSEHDGLLFILGGDEAQGLLNLARITTDKALRIHRQNGGALFQSLETGAYDDVVLKTVIVEQSITLPESIDCKSLFPPPSIDEVYKHLFSLPSIVDPPERDPHSGHPVVLPVGRPLLDVPLYLCGGDPTSSTLEMTRILVGGYGPPPNDDERQVIVLPWTLQFDVGVSPLDPPPIPDGGHIDIVLYGRTDRTSDPDFRVWGCRKFVLLYPASYSIPQFLFQKDVYPIFRGLAVDIDESGVPHVQALTEDIDHLRGSDWDAPWTAPLREHFYFLTRELNTKTAYLRSVDESFHFEWTDWKTRKLENPFELARQLFQEQSALGEEPTRPSRDPENQ